MTEEAQPKDEALGTDCGLSEGTNELKGALGCFLLDTYYVNGEERETEGREPHGAQRRGSERISLHVPAGLRP